MPLSTAPGLWSLPRTITGCVHSMQFSAAHDPRQPSTREPRPMRTSLFLESSDGDVGQLELPVTRGSHFARGLEHTVNLCVALPILEVPLKRHALPRADESSSHWRPLASPVRPFIGLWPPSVEVSVSDSISRAI